MADVLSDTSSINKWTCTCSSANQGSQNYTLAANCSKSCDCSPGMTFHSHIDASYGYRHGFAAAERLIRDACSFV